MREWPFLEDEQAAVITLRAIMDGTAPILHVTHDSDDGRWEFLGWEAPAVAEATVAALREVVERDPSVAELADLPRGWHAWRTTVDSPWIREPNPDDAE
ncbi:MAG TPA: hypothetical protein VFU47_16300 [Armatimonadota bacterium]|nr:hypothetical protein [Armatimonadota bacterium]